MYEFTLRISLENNWLVICYWLSRVVAKVLKVQKPHIITYWWWRFGRHHVSRDKRMFLIGNIIRFLDLENLRQPHRSLP